MMRPADRLGLECSVRKRGLTRTWSGIRGEFIELAGAASMQVTSAASGVAAARIQASGKGVGAEVARSCGIPFQVVPDDQPVVSLTGRDGQCPKAPERAP